MLLVGAALSLVIFWSLSSGAHHSYDTASSADDNAAGESVASRLSNGVSFFADKSGGAGAAGAGGGFWGGAGASSCQSNVVDGIRLQRPDLPAAMVDVQNDTLGVSCFRFFFSF
jgi:hypothetical protein